VTSLAPAAAAPRDGETPHVPLSPPRSGSSPVKSEDAFATLLAVLVAIFFVALVVVLYLG